MKKLIRRRPKAAMIVAIIALVAALGGTAVAGGGKFLPKSKFSNFKQNTAVKGPITYVNQTQNVGPSTTGTGTNITANCPSGFFPVGGGAKTNENSTTSLFFILNSYPSATGWTANVTAGNTGPPVTTESVTVTAICEKAKTSGTPPPITP